MYNLEKSTNSPQVDQKKTKDTAAANKDNTHIEYSCC